MNPVAKLIIAAFAATTLSPLAVMAEGTNNPDYLVEPASANTVVRSGFGLCWHTAEWTPSSTSEPCDPASAPVAVVAPPPAKPPVVIAAVPPAPPAPEPAKAIPQKIGFSGDALFAFDKSVLKPEGKTMLDGLVSKIGGATSDTITVTGHTDRFGSNAYNQKLSERRAQAVKDYLVSKNVQAGSIGAEGKGETQPVTKASDCLGAKSAKVVACLQPDRRVDVEMTGTKIVTGSR